MSQHTHRPDTPRRLASSSGAAMIAAAAALHVVWSTGSSWPARDRRTLAELVAGAEEFPDRTACLTVAGLLGGAAWVAATERGGAAGRLARSGVVGVFAVRGAAGLAGATGALVPWTPTGRFTAMDRRCYGPLCLAIAGLVGYGRAPSTGQAP